MKGPFSKSPRYGLIVDQDKEERSPVEADEPGQKTTAIEKSARPWMLWVLLLLMVTAVLTATLFVRYTRESTYRSSSSCAKSALRREWRSLKLAEKQEYIKAVNCLRDQPSRLGLDQSLYDDFSYTHARSGVSAHYSAAFIPWHRYFIHTYEEALRLQCSYSGHLTYWDWTLDWEDFSTSPVWSIETGFGGSGDPEVGEDILGGHCVTTGPFANLHVTYLEQVYKPHCLSRGFIHNTTELAVHNALYSPMRVHQILRSKTYEEFNFELEDGPHNGVPRSIRGDFNNLTAPAGKLTHPIDLSSLIRNLLRRSRVLPASYAIG